MGTLEYIKTEDATYAVLWRTPKEDGNYVLVAKEQSLDTCLKGEIPFNELDAVWAQDSEDKLLAIPKEMGLRLNQMIEGEIGAVLQKAMDAVAAANGN